MSSNISLSEQPISRGSAKSPKASFRTDIQGLRTIAVMAVVLYHLWPQRLTGGFVGVDVFFVISGYLITGHMFRELSRPNDFSLVKFWARRIRRLLPAAFLVLLVSLAAVFFFVPQTLWASSAKQIGASALYLQNWVLASDAVDYSALNADATVAQHYWSLSIEEQFYIMWPLILILTLWITTRTFRLFSATPPPKRSVLMFGLSVIGVGSLIFSIYETAINPSAAYFVTGTRIWEFAVGGLVALVFLDRQLENTAATVISWLGLLGIASSAILYSGSTAFPGYTALMPVLGTAAILSCSGKSGVLSPAWLLSRRPMTFLGDISYAIYLWHWPLIVVAPFLLHVPLSAPIKLAILTVTVLLSWLTKLLVEDPARLGAALKLNLAAYSFAVVGMALVVGLSFGLVNLTNQKTSDSITSQSSTCFGPNALNPNNACSSVIGDEPPIPSAVLVSKQNKEPLYPGCQSGGAGTEPSPCQMGVPVERAKKTVALVGDSHATAWFPAVDAIAAKNQWHVITYAKASCPVTDALRVLDNEKTDEDQQACYEWGQRVRDLLLADDSIDTIFTAAYSSAYTYKNPAGTQLANPAVDGFISMWSSWQSAGKKVVIFDDVPRTNGQYVPTCLESNPSEPLKCGAPISQALPDTMNITKAAEQMSAKGITRIKLRDYFCDATLCYPLVGSVIVYRDYSHVSADYSRALAPFIEAQLDTG